MALGVDHIDTSDFYGPYVTNRLIREALHPYAENLTLVTKIGAWRNDTGDWILERDADFLRRSVEGNLEHLGLERMTIVNLRMGGPEDDVAAPMRAMRRMQEECLFDHIGISTVDAAQLRIARDIAPVVCVQNHYNLVHRDDDAMIDALTEDGIAYVPYFPLGGFTPLQVAELDRVAGEMGKSPQSVALAWLLQRSPNILLIPGTSQRTPPARQRCRGRSGLERGSPQAAGRHRRRGLISPSVARDMGFDVEDRGAVQHIQAAYLDPAALDGQDLEYRQSDRIGAAPASRC